MEFRVLGPLEVDQGGRGLALGGFKQRAVLGLLLLRANQVIATSELLGALWPEESRPVTARKIVQNAVWGLRALLPDPDGTEPSGGVVRPELLTRPPGYVLRVDPERLDASRFDRKVAAGRARLAAGEPAKAAALLGDALGEWRGSALSDLVEQGVEWPELTALQQLRLDAMEDRFEAELACGRHHAVLGELSSFAEGEPLRERLCGQLMLALYRCGRQAEALGVFSKVRLALVEEYGLEPSADLRALQQRILRHDQTLATPTGGWSDEQGAEVPRARPAVVTGPDADAAPRAGHGLSAAGGPPEHAVADTPTAAPLERTRPLPQEPATAVRGPQDPAVGGGPGSVTERRHVCVLVVRTESGGAAGPVAPEQLDTSLHDTVTVLAESVEAHGGTLVGSMGGLSAAVFGLRADPGEAPLNAVRAAFQARERLAHRSGTVLRAVVTEGTAIVRHEPHDPTAAIFVVGTLLDRAHGLLAAVPAGEVYVSDDVARDTDDWVQYSQVVRGPEPVTDIRQAHALRPRGAVVRGVDAPHGRERELAVLDSLLEYSGHHEVPCLLTVLGERGVGKTRLVAQFERRVARDSDEVRVVRPRALKGGPDAAGMAAALLDAWGTPQGAPALGPPEHRLRALVSDLAASEADEARLLRMLVPPPGLPGPARPGDVLAAWRELIERTAQRQPLVLCLDDLHLADDDVLDWVAELSSGTGRTALLVVACGHPELLRRRPLWGSGRQHGGTLTLSRLREPVPLPRRMAPVAGAKRYGERGVSRGPAVRRARRGTGAYDRERRGAS
ncbi:BTAD domain-containing putative transcriptional regulator [Streptomyces sp. NPDC000151]|uniref:BTAD domain-containing putative transcriptional regulator n=1 Tax=Streptomyces sp. NPDC000151 TaxID=3154244 RepID=UPI0033229B65